MVKQEMARVNMTCQESVNTNGHEWANLIQMTIISTTVGKKSLRRNGIAFIEKQKKEPEMQYLGMISKTTE